MDPRHQRQPRPVPPPARNKNTGTKYASTKTSSPTRARGREDIAQFGDALRVGVLRVSLTTGADERNRIFVT